MMYDKLQKSKPAITKKVNEAPRMLRAGTSGSNKQSDAQKLQQQKTQLRNSGKVRDAAALFEQFLE
jgi:hypothetical protein